jgi:hypothetical protein
LALRLDSGDRFLASHLNSLEPVYVEFFRGRTTILAFGAVPSKIATSCREERQPFSVCVVRKPRRETA